MGKEVEGETPSSTKVDEETDRRRTRLLVTSRTGSELKKIDVYRRYLR